MLFNSVHHNADTALNEPLSFAMKDSQDFHTALYLAPKQKNLDPQGMYLTHRAIDELSTEKYPVQFMKFTDFTRLFLLVVEPVRAMAARMGGKDPNVEVLKLPPSKYSKKYWVAFRIIG